ncbi:MAG: peptidoglycan editing factor PgeF, partial [Pseudomonadota bacterium]
MLTGDCLPIVLADASGRALGMAHAGWRGLAAGVIESTVAAMRDATEPNACLLAWIGP